jgi:hypothetical protein
MAYTRRVIGLERGRLDTANKWEPGTYLPSGARTGGSSIDRPTSQRRAPRAYLVNSDALVVGRTAIALAFCCPVKQPIYRPRLGEVVPTCDTKLLAAEGCRCVRPTDGRTVPPPPPPQISPDACVVVDGPVADLRASLLSSPGTPALQRSGQLHELACVCGGH